MSDVSEHWRQPFLAVNPQSNASDESLAVCPGIQLRHQKTATRPHKYPASDLFDGWGSVLNVWERYSTDSDIRLAGSSGGDATALSLYFLENKGVVGVSHTAAGRAVPRLSGFWMFWFWLKKLSSKEKLSSFFGTAKRGYAKKLTCPCNIGEWKPEDLHE